MAGRNERIIALHAHGLTFEAAALFEVEHLPDLHWRESSPILGTPIGHSGQFILAEAVARRKVRKLWAKMVFSLMVLDQYHVEPPDGAILEMRYRRVQ